MFPKYNYFFLQNRFLIDFNFARVESFAEQWKMKIKTPKIPLKRVQIEYNTRFWSYSAIVPSKKVAKTVGKIRIKVRCMIFAFFRSFSFTFSSFLYSSALPMKIKVNSSVSVRRALHFQSVRYIKSMRSM